MYSILLNWKPAVRLAAMCMIAGCVIMSLSERASAQNCGGRGGPPPKSSGTKFLLVFMSNETLNYDQSTNRYQDIYLASNDPDNFTTVTITCRAYPGWAKVIQLPPHGDTSIRVSSEPGFTFPGHDAIVETPEVVDSTVFKVVASAPITCYGMSNKEFTADAFLALPYDPSSTEYRIMSYYNSNQPGLPPMPSEFAVASFDNNDTVWITPSATTSSGWPKGKEMMFVLDSGECVQIQGDPNEKLGDLTGSMVHSKSPIAVYGGHVRTESPNGFNYVQNGQNTTRDHLCEAMPPLSTWGKSFIAKNFGRPNGDVLRVLAYIPNTTVWINGNKWGNRFQENEFRDTVIDQSGIELNNIAAVESDNPILVGMIAHTANPGDQLGDPFLAIVPPLEQTYTDFTYFLSNDNTNYKSDQHYLIIASEQSEVGNIIVDDKLKYPKSSYTTVPYLLNNGKQYSVITVNQTPGIHRIFSPGTKEQGFTILAYGWGTVISYGYTAGQLLVPLTGIISVTTPKRGVAPDPGKPAPTIPSITVRNILAEKVYFDSARVSYTQNAQNVAVRLKKDIAIETGTLKMAEEKKLELATSKPVEDVIAGKVTLWYHTALWTTLAPVDFPFVITPESQAGVNASTERNVVLENYPNPAAGRTTVHYQIPRDVHGSVKLYDALGRTVKIVAQGTLSGGGQEMYLSTKDLIPGEYTLELAAPELGINEHRKIIVVE